MARAAAVADRVWQGPLRLSGVRAADTWLSVTDRKTASLLARSLQARVEKVMRSRLTAPASDVP